MHSTRLPRMIWILGSMMFFMNISYVMIYAFGALYLKAVLGVDTARVGMIEGLVEALSYLMKFVSGALSDFWKKRKPIMLLGYGFSICARLLLAVIGTYVTVFCARVFERIGNGIQATPRDAIVADLAPTQHIGASYGLKRSLATFGSFMGAVVGFVIMHWSGDNILLVFQMAAIPALLAFLILIFFVKEPKRFEHSAVSAELPLPAVKRRHPFSWGHLRLLGSSFWWVMLVNTIFMASRINESFMILHGHGNLGLEKRGASIVMMVYNLGCCFSAYPVGVLADRMNRYGFLAIGITFLILSDSILAWATSLPMFFLGVLLWGVQMGITQNIFLSLIAEIVPESLRGTGLGVYYILSAISVFFGDALAGYLSKGSNEAYAFWMSGLIATASLLTLMGVLTLRRNTLSRS